MSKLLPILFLILALDLFAQGVPESATILEKTNVTATRQLVLWMSNPSRNPRDAEEMYTCPEETRGHYYSGIAHVSLIDLKTKKVINTIEIDANGENSLDLPYLIHRGYYSVPKVDKNKEGNPRIMKLLDYNVDGKPFEFAIFDAVACMGLETTLIGYSEKQDKVMQYETELKIHGKISKDRWVDYLFGHKPNKKGVWKFHVDYRGRAGAFEKYEIRYDKKREIFYGKRTSLFEE